MQTVSIPRWLLIATAVLLASAIFAIVVHPYYNVSKATSGESLLLAFVVTAAAGVAFGIANAPRVVVARLPQPKASAIVERNCIRRI